MIINRIDFPIYETLILFSIIVGALYIFIAVDKKDLTKKNIIVFFILFFLLSISLGKLYTLIEHPDTNFFKIGVTGYGGLIGAILASIIYNFIYKDNRFLKK